MWYDPSEDEESPHHFLSSCTFYLSLETYLFECRMKGLDLFFKYSPRTSHRNFDEKFRFFDPVMA